MSIEGDIQNARVAVLIRGARSAIGMNQQQFADLMGVSRTTVARIETLQMAAKADFLIKALGLFKSAGVEIDLFQSSGVSFHVTEEAIIRAQGHRKDDPDQD